MRNPKVPCALIVVVAWMVVGCGDDSSTSSTATIELRVVSFTPGEDNVPIEGAEVCFLDTDDCQTTGADGVVFLEVPIDAETAVTLTADGFNPTLSPQVAESSTPAPRDVSMLSVTLLQALATAFDSPYPPDNTGFVAVTVLGEPRDLETALPGVTMTLVDPQGRQYYLTDEGLPNFDLTETSALGTGGLIEIPPGVHEIELGGAVSNCTRLAGWAGSGDLSMRFPVEVGFFTNTLLICDKLEAP